MTSNSLDRRLEEVEAFKANKLYTYRITAKWASDASGAPIIAPMSELVRASDFRHAVEQANALVRLAGNGTPPRGMSVSFVR